MEAGENLNMVEDAFHHHYFIIYLVLTDDYSIL